MRNAGSVLLLPFLIAAAPGSGLPPGLYTNEEQVYFEKDSGRAPPPWLSFEVDAQGRMRTIDAYGAPARAPQRFRAKADGERLIATFADGRTTQLRRARPVTCWSAVKKDVKTAEGKDDWYFSRAVKLHDQGGRALVGGGQAELKPVVIRMRYVTWEGSKNASNRPSLVLYVHKPEEPDSALSYVWADPRSSRVGINLRWMQASCTIDGMEEPSQIDKQNFRG